MAENNSQTGFNPSSNGHKPNANLPANGNAFDFRDAGLALIPVTPVGFTGRGSAMAWIRLLMYGSLACVTWKKNRTVSYLAMGAAGLSLTTSLAGGAWNPDTPKTGFNPSVNPSTSAALGSQEAAGGAFA